MHLSSVDEGEPIETQALPTLRPFRLGELLDRAFRLYRGRFLTLIGILAVAYAPLMVFSIAVSVLLNSSTLERLSISQERFVHLLFSILTLVLFIFVQGIATGALTRTVAHDYLAKKIGIRGAYRETGKYWFTLVGALLLLGGSVLVIVVWWIVPVIGWFTGLGMILFMTTVINRFLPSAVVLEDQGALSALKRAWSLARRRFWPVLGYALTLSLFGMIVQIIISILIGAIGSVLPVEYFFDFFERLVALIFTLLYYPLQITAFTLLYFDLRVRTEGFDLALLTMRDSDSTDVSPAMMSAIPPMKERLLTWLELGYFALLTPVGVIIYMFFYPFLFGSLSFLPFLLP